MMAPVKFCWRRTFGEPCSCPSLKGQTTICPTAGAAALRLHGIEQMGTDVSPPPRGGPWKPSGPMWHRGAKRETNCIVWLMQILGLLRPYSVEVDIKTSALRITFYYWSPRSYYVRRYVRKNVKRYVRKSVRVYVRENVKRYVPRIAEDMLARIAKDN